ncbi:MAG: hypothetical protein ACTHLK_18755 [Brucella intermedia]
MTALSDGGWVVSWHGNPSGTYNIYQQRYSQDGSKQGSETLVNTTTTGNELSPSVTALSDGGWIVTWYGNASGTNNVYQQRFDANGNKVELNTGAVGDAVTAEPELMQDHDDAAVITAENHGHEKAVLADNGHHGMSNAGSGETEPAHGQTGGGSKDDAGVAEAKPAAGMALLQDNAGAQADASHDGGQADIALSHRDLADPQGAEASANAADPADVAGTKDVSADRQAVRLVARPS